MSSSLSPSTSPHPEFSCLWHPDSATEQPDSYVAFRGTFDLERAGEIEFRLLGATWFVAHLDGEWLGEGPARFHIDFPEYQTYRVALQAGRHVMAVQVHHLGVAMRILNNVPPFWWCVVKNEGAEMDVSWKTFHLQGYAPRRRRINPQLGWAEWCDTREIPIWQEKDFDDSCWLEAQKLTRPLGPPGALSTSNTRSIAHQGQVLASGSWHETYGYEKDNPPARFFLRELCPARSPAKLPPQGVWKRYDLGRVRLMRPRFLLDVPPGAVVEFAYCEALQHGRVCPWITLSASDSCNLDHYVARGGVQEFSPLTPKGGRFVEVHILAPPDEVRFVREEFVERAFYGASDGAFRCDDALLGKIWEVGVETHRACSEDALVDNPTRERGQWAGDVVTVGMDIAGAAFGDLALCRRGLVQCAQSAREDGLVSGMCPGQNVFLSTYAAQWISACVHFWELTGERELLDEMWEFAKRNLAAFEAKLTPQGLESSLGWGFVDWGYVKNSGASDMGVNLHYLAALRDMKRWCDAVARPNEAAHYIQVAQQLTALLDDYYNGEFQDSDGAWGRIGYHRAVLGMRLGFFQSEKENQALQFIKAHMLNCFPNDEAAPRLSDPRAGNPRLITPYFAHYAMPLLFERGEADFALDQFRKCWGWALEEDRTTWLEVFDTRWSHCHQWAGCPTWQLSRFVLGLEARQDLGIGHYRLSLFPGSLQEATGLVPINGTDQAIRVSWHREGEAISYHLETPVAVTLHIEEAGIASRVVEVKDNFATTFTGREFREDK